MQNRQDVINAALQRCGAAGINLAFQDTQESAIAIAAYDRCRKLVLSQYPWWFAQKYVRMGQSVDTQPFGYDYAHTLPGDCVSIVDIHPYLVEDGDLRDANMFQNKKAEWEIVGKDVVSNSPFMALRYVSDEEMDMPEFFADALAWRLAFEIAPYLQQGTNQAGFFLQMYQQSLDEARVENDRRTNPERVPDWKESKQVHVMRSHLEERW